MLFIQRALLDDERIQNRQYTNLITLPEVLGSAWYFCVIWIYLHLSSETITLKNLNDFCLFLKRW